jgi:hypothetical protein
MQSDVVVLFVDPAFSDGETADPTVMLWCVLRGGVLRVLGGGAVKCGDSISLAEKIVASNPAPLPVYIEGKVVATVRKYITETLAPGRGWDIIEIPISNEDGAKAKRISRAATAVVKTKRIVIESTAPESVKTHLKEQLSGEDTLHDDFADCLGLAHDVAFGTETLSSASPELNVENCLGGDACMCIKCRSRRRLYEETRDISEPYKPLGY